MAIPRIVVNRPDCEKAHAFQVYRCVRPDCGIHVVPERKDGSPICEMIISQESVRELLELIHNEGLDL